MSQQIAGNSERVFLVWHSVNLRQWSWWGVWRVSPMRSTEGQCLFSLEKRSLTWELFTCTVSWNEIVSGWGSAPSPSQAVTGQKNIASTCTRVGSGWTSGRSSSLKGWSDIGMSCPKMWWSHHPWKNWRKDWTCHLALWFSLYDGVWSKVGLNDLKDLSQPQWFYSSKYGQDINPVK